MRRNHFYVYIITNLTNSTFYIGITNNLERRMWEHKNGLNEGFSKKYNLKKLVYYETFSNSIYAISREKQLKNWHRQWKINLIKLNNPEIRDISDEWDCNHTAQKILKQVQDDSVPGTGTNPNDPETSSG